MAVGPGKYDELATYVRKRSEAHTAVVIVLGGARGNGFSVQTEIPTMESWLPAFLRQMADEIEGSTRN